jgi:purine nucleoside phosphorylase
VTASAAPGTVGVIGGSGLYSVLDGIETGLELP